MFDGKQMLQFVDSLTDGDGNEVNVYINHKYEYVFYKSNLPVTSVYDTSVLAILIKLKYKYEGEEFTDENIQRFVDEFRELYYDSSSFERRLITQEALIHLDCKINQLLKGVRKDIRKGKIKPCPNSKTTNLRLSSPILKD